RSMSRVGTPTDNPIIESLNGWIKAQIRCDYNINEWDSLEEFLEKYVYYFNHYRPSFKLHY
ncbi:MAG: integrase core domain-containing protein, partial [Anaerorhabdus sp.]|uniref:integrase core domain-containing protein n=1 Tax=Anaerorhabdus sp. TaxID=1872524 RepID=UPI003A84A0C7